MNILHLPKLTAALGCAVVLAFSTTTSRAAQGVQLPSVDVGVEQGPGELITSARTDGNGVTVIKIAQAGDYTVVVQPLAKNKTGNYSRARVNTTGVMISGAAKPATGSYNLTGTAPCRVEISVTKSTTLTVKITPPPPPARNDEVKPAMQ